MAWWIRPEKGGFVVATKYKNAGLAGIQQRKVSDANYMGDIKDSFTKNVTASLPGDLVCFTLNNGDLEELPQRSVRNDLAGEYRVYLSLDGENFALHPESYPNLTRANQIVKKYLRQHYKSCAVMYCKRGSL